MRIRTMKPADLHPLAKINAGIYPETTPALALRTLKLAFKNKIPGAALVAEEDGGLAGAIFIEKRITFTAHAAYVHSIFVEKTRRGKGIGRKLMARGLRAAKRHGVKSLSLGVEGENCPAMRLYKKFGFRPFRLLLLRKF